MRPRLRDRVELPPHRAGLGVERIRGAATARRVADRPDEDEALPEDRRDVHELFGRAREMAAPKFAAALRVERERIRIRDAVDAAVAEGETVRPVVAKPVVTFPALRAGPAVEREDVAAHILDEYGVSGDDGSRGEDAGVAAPRVKPEAPAHAQPGDVAGVDRRVAGCARAREVGVRKRPFATAPVAAAPGCETRDHHRSYDDQCML